jgi:hypothetical protein
MVAAEMLAKLLAKKFLGVSGAGAAGDGIGPDARGGLRCRASRFRRDGVRLAHALEDHVAAG